MSESDRPAAPEEDQAEKDAVLREDDAGRRPSEGKAGKMPPDGEIIGELGDEVGGPA